MCWISKESKELRHDVSMGGTNIDDLEDSGGSCNVIGNGILLNWV